MRAHVKAASLLYVKRVQFLVPTLVLKIALAPPFKDSLELSSWKLRIVTLSKSTCMCVDEYAYVLGVLYTSPKLLLILMMRKLRLPDVLLLAQLCKSVALLGFEATSA